MQTFLTSSNYTKAAKALDNKRLGNQCYRECKTLINGKWANHPASKMWKGYERSLAKYAYALACEMGKRKHWKPEVVARWKKYWLYEITKHPDTGNPPWLGDENFHVAHQSNLIRKDPNFYKSKFPNVPDDLPYIWPV